MTWLEFVCPGPFPLKRSQNIAEQWNCAVPRHQLCHSHLGCKVKSGGDYQHLPTRYPSFLVKFCYSHYSLLYSCFFGNFWQLYSGDWKLSPLVFDLKGVFRVGAAACFTSWHALTRPNAGHCWGLERDYPSSITRGRDTRQLGSQLS